MNTAQRQILSDKINDAKFQVEDLQHAVDYQEQKLEKYKQRLAEAKALVEELSEGVDW